MVESFNFDLNFFSRHVIANDATSFCYFRSSSFLFEMEGCFFPYKNYFFGCYCEYNPFAG